jgi:hypothetical protein
VRFFVSGFFGLKIPAPPTTSAPTSWAIAVKTDKDIAADRAAKIETNRKIEEALTRSS